MSKHKYSQMRPKDVTGPVKQHPRTSQGVSVSGALGGVKQGKFVGRADDAAGGNHAGQDGSSAAFPSPGTVKSGRM